MDHYISTQFYINTYFSYVKKTAPDISVFQGKALFKQVITQRSHTHRTFSKISQKRG